MDKEDYIPYEEYVKIRSDGSGHDIGFSEAHTWGRGAAGLFIRNNDEVLLLLRSEGTLDYGFWGIPGGARKETKNGLEDALVTALEEAREEIGYLPRGNIKRQPYVFRKPNSKFTYETYILDVWPIERQIYSPVLNWEHCGWRWFEVGKLDPMIVHPGVMEVVRNYKF